MDGGSKKVKVDLASKPKGQTPKRRKPSNQTMRAMQLMNHMRQQITKKRSAMQKVKPAGGAPMSSAEAAIAYFNRKGEPSKPSKLGEMMSVEAPATEAREPPFGCLKGGTKPTRGAARAAAQVALAAPAVEVLDAPVLDALDALDAPVASSALDAPVAMAPRPRRPSRRNVKRYHVGRKVGGRTVGVMCYDERTRKRHHRQHRQSLPKDTQAMKLDLYNKFILRKGSIAPPGLIREAYESTKILGDTIGASSTDIINAHVMDTIDVR